jgi:hypothetical protein
MYFLSANFNASFEIIPFIICLVFTFYWGLSIFKHRITNRTAISNWSIGITMIWLCLVMLWGPFIDNRLIDLSYAAALKLDMVKAGTAQVEIKTVTEKNDNLNAQINEDAYLQIGAFEDKKNAYNYLELLKDNNFNSASVRKEYNWLKPLSPNYKVQIGPIENKKQHNKLLSRLRKIGVYQTKIVTN